MNAYVQKPFEPVQLFAIIMRFLAAARKAAL